MDRWHYPRHKLCDYILQGMQQGLLERVTFFAPRKRGKTQFITRDVIPACDNIDVLPIYIDFWSDKDSPQNAFIDAVTTTLESRRNLFSKILAKLKFTPAVSSSGVTVKAEANVTSAQRPTLHSVFDALNTHHTPILLLLDEVQHLATSADYASFTAALRSFMTARSDNKIKAIFTGSSQEGLNKLFKNTKAPFYDASQTIPFPQLDRDFVIHQLGVFKSVTGGRELDEETAFSIFTQQQFHPARFSEMLKYMALEGIYDIQVGFDEHDQRYLLNERSEFAKSIEQLNPLDKVLLKLLAKDWNKGLYTDETKSLLESELGKRPSNPLIGAALTRLAEQDLIYNESRGVWLVADPSLKSFMSEK